MFRANVLARVRAKSRGVRAQASKVRLKVQGKAEREQMLVGAARETHNSNSRSKADKGNVTTITVAGATT